MQVWDTYDGPVVSVAFAPDSRRLAVASRNTIDVHAVGADRPAVTVGHRCFRQVAFTPDGSRVVADGGIYNRVHSWDPDTGAETHLAQPNGFGWVFAFDPAGRLATYSIVEHMSNDLQWYSFPDGRWVEEWTDLSPTGGYVFRFSPDGRFLALPSYLMLTVWDVARRKHLWSGPEYQGPTPLLAYSPDGSRLVTGAGRRLTTFNTRGYTPEFEVRSGRPYFTAIAYHPSGRWLAATVGDAVRMYDTTTWEVARTYSWEVGKLRCVAFSPDGTLAATGGDAGKVVVWDVDG